ncbi:MAG: T9SS type A sorting domain-containing protein [Alphaproteobacteria bacterium]|nr:T9SS type A sorting domain-containing protein [Alphaproteobacteria bacterium]
MKSIRLIRFKKIFNKIIVILLLYFNLIRLEAQQVPPLLLTVENQHYVNDSTFRYAIYLTNIGTNNFSLEGLGISVKFNSGWRNNGTMNQSSVVNGVFASPHTLIETGLENATTFQGSTVSLAVAGEHFPYHYGSSENAFFQKSSTLSKANGILVTPNYKLYIGLFELKNTVAFNKTLGAGLQFNFNPIQGTQIYEDSAVLGKNLFYTYYQIGNAIVAAEAPDTLSVSTKVDSAIISFPLVTKNNGYFTGNYDSSALIQQYLVRVYNASNELYGIYSGSSSPVIIKGLPSGNYSFSVAALNLADTSEESPRSAVQSITKGISISAIAYNGFISPANIQVLSGGQATFNYSGVFGYALDSIFINGVYNAVASNDSLKSLTLYNITANTHIIVKFALVVPYDFPFDTLTLCQGTTVDYLENTYPNSVWYQYLTSISPFLNTVLLNTGYYYGSTYFKGVESQLRDSIYIRFYNIVVPQINDTFFCSNQVSSSQLLSINPNVIWYNSRSNLLDTLNVSGNLTSKYYYYRVRQFGCISNPDSILVTILPTFIDLNLADTSFCVNDNAKVLNLVQTSGNAQVYWYQSKQSLQRLADTIKLVSGKYYYKPKILSNSCISEYDSIDVTIFNNPVAPILNDTTFCNPINSISVVGNLYPNITNLLWYDTNLYQAESLLTLDTLFEKEYYYTIFDANGCQSNFNSIYVSVLYHPLKPIINSVNVGNSQLTLEVNRDQDNNVQFYQLIGSPGNIFQISNSPEITVSNLINNTTYTFRVIAVNCAGYSDTSDLVMGTPLPNVYNINTSVVGGVGGYITPTIAVGRGTSIRITYFALSKYILDSVFVNGRFVPDSTMGYTFSNVTGDSNIRVSFRPFIVPNAPVITNIIAGYGTATLYFIHTNGAGPKTNFYTVYTSDNTYVIQATSSPIKISGLNPNLTYQFKIYAFNQAGSSLASNLSNPITPNVKMTAIVTTIAGSNGTISPKDTVDIGTSLRITYQGNSGYQVDSVWVNNYYVKDSLSGYTFNNIRGDSTIQVSFRKSSLILPNNNFKIVISNPSCIGISNGNIMINIDSALNYKLRLVGKGIDTTAIVRSMLSVANLSQGKYTLYITINNFDSTYFYKRFDMTLSEPLPISSYSVVNSESKIAELHLQGGGKTYYVSINGKIIETQLNSIQLPLQIGVNTLIIKTDKLCLDSSVERILVSENIILYPNPAHNIIHLNVGGTDTEVNIDIYDEKGNLIIHEAKSMLEDRNLSINIENLAHGVYLVKVNGKTIFGTYKFVKQ